ncbi:hypothetical protein MASR2M78_16650 [Treponema sp.]
MLHRRSPGDFYVCSFGSEGGSERLAKELERIAPHEILVQESLLEEQGKLAKVIAERSNLMVNRWPDWLFDTVRGADRLEAQFGTSNLKGFGLDRSSIEVLAAGAILSYLDDTAQSLLPHVRNLKVYGDDDYVGIDESSQRNLELVRSIREGDSRFLPL